MRIENDILSNLEGQDLASNLGFVAHDFNLLAWREQIRIEAGKKFWQIYAVCLSSVSLVLLLIHFVLNYQIKLWSDLNQLLNNETTQLQTRIQSYAGIVEKVKVLNGSMAVIKGDQLSMHYLISVLDALPRFKPVGIKLIKLDYENNKVIVSGQAEHVAAVSSFVKKIQMRFPDTRVLLRDLNLVTDMARKNEDFKIEIDYKKL